MITTYLGTFDTVDQVLSKYPNGGADGDMLIVDAQPYQWNKESKSWESITYKNTSYENATIYCDLHAKKDLYVDGTLHVNNLKQPNCGLYKDAEALNAKNPTPDVGNWAIVGTQNPIIYICEKAGVWKNSGQEYSGDPISLDGYVSQVNFESTTNELDEKNQQIKNAFNELDSSTLRIQDDTDNEYPVAGNRMIVMSLSEFNALQRYEDNVLYVVTQPIETESD